MHHATHVHCPHHDDDDNGDDFDDDNDDDDDDDDDDDGDDYDDDKTVCEQYMDDPPLRLFRTVQLFHTVMGTEEPVNTML